MRAKKRKPADRRQLARIAHDAVRVAFRARCLRDLITSAAGAESPAAEAAQECLSWATEAADRLASLVEERFGRRERPAINGAEMREEMSEPLDEVHLEVSLAARERSRKERR